MTIDDLLKKSLREHLGKMKSIENGQLHGTVIGIVEKSLLKIVMEETDGNQSDASRILGINRNTLRKKIREYKIVSHP
ncbi:MAG: Fis family transcriptional regulator [Nitrospinae bacterium]|nr:Fis family transcriptional regulator [Nitrospinota bacterium]